MGSPRLVLGLKTQVLMSTLVKDVKSPQFVDAEHVDSQELKGVLAPCLCKFELVLRSNCMSKSINMCVLESLRHIYV